MGGEINKLPPPWPNAALALSRVASDAQLRARVEQASETAPIKTGVGASIAPEPEVAPEIDVATASGDASSETTTAKVDIKV